MGDILSFYALLQAYLLEAKVFAGMHGMLIVTCVLLWVAESRRIAIEARALEQAKKPGHQADPSTEVGKIRIVASSLAEKDRLVDTSSMTQRLTRAISPSDAAFRACINGFIVIGFLGTLYNLWHLGPGFWKALLQPSQSMSGPLINVAFAASIFGLVWALLFSLADSFIMQPRREDFVKEAVDWLFSAVSTDLPPSTQAMLSRSVAELNQAATSLLKTGADVQTEVTQRWLIIPRSWPIN